MLNERAASVAPRILYLLRKAPSAFNTIFD